MADDFLSTYAPLANDIATRTGVDPSVVLGIIDTETGGGRHVSGNNIFGISPGGRVAGYPDVQTASEAFISLMQTPRYRSVVAAGDPASQSAALVKSGYNTVNPQYANIVANKALSFSKQLGYQDNTAGGTEEGPADYSSSAQPVAAATQPSAPAPAPAQQPPPAAQPAGSATDRLIRELQPPAAGQPQQPPATNGQPPSATDRLITELQTPSGGDFTGPPGKKPLPSSAGEEDAPAVTPEGGSFSFPTRGQGPAPAPYSALPIFPGPAPGAVPRIIEAGREGAAGAPDTSAWAPGGLELGKYLVNPLLQLGGAAFRGGQQFLQEAINPVSPGLGRDIAAMPEAFPTGAPEFHPLQPTAAEARTKLGRPVTLDEIKDAMRRSDQAAAASQPQPSVPSDRPPSLDGPPPPAGPSGGKGAPTPEPSGGGGGGYRPDVDPTKPFTYNPPSSGWPAGTARWAEREVEAGGPQPAGAEVTTAPIPEKTKAQKATDIRKDVTQTATERAGPGLKDDNPYFDDPNNPIPPRPQAYRDFTPQTALDHKYFYSKDTDYRAGIDEIDRQRNIGMTDSLRTEMGDTNTRRAFKEQRDEVTPDAMGVFKDEKPVDPNMLEGFRAKVQGLLDGPFQKRGKIRSILEDVYSTLFDKNGNIETLPSKLQGVRDNMTDWLDLKSGSSDTAKAVQAGQHVITGLVDDLNPVMNSGAPKWDQWRAEWAKRSQAINQQDFLQNYEPGRSKSLWDGQGNLQYRKVQQLVADIANSYDKPVHDAHSLTAAQIQRIVQVRNELAAKDFARVQGLQPGSPTHQLFERAAKEGGTTLGKTLGRMGVEYAAHGIGAYAASRGIPGVNAVIGMYQSTRPLREQRKVVRRAATLEEQSNALKAGLLEQRPYNPLQP